MFNIQHWKWDPKKCPDTLVFEHSVQEMNACRSPPSHAWSWSYANNTKHRKWDSWMNVLERNTGNRVPKSLKPCMVLKVCWHSGADHYSFLEIKFWKRIVQKLCWHSGSAQNSLPKIMFKSHSPEVTVWYADTLGLTNTHFWKWSLPAMHSPEVRLTLWECSTLNTGNYVYKPYIQ